MHFTRPRELAVAAVLGLVLTYVVFQLVYGDLPPLPLLAGVTFAVLAVIEAILAYSIRSRIRAGRVVGAIRIARSVALAKASSLAGAFMTGAWVAAFAYVFPRRDELVAAGSDSRSAVAGAVSSALLVAAGLWLEHCCRTPPGSDRDRGRGATG
ncbi:DUF3180 domain-containing protein [Amycolatopsis sp. PS_44_ISF1]|uniref:DUF3180 domain-containing protein n=1 Tax=Amycolatopsis sp. PS_44_ISF1 TaxID=2974917 RepID=UPI0028DF845E|nr:DUF3180 domain-containing protein [Amycolatopsis sp. PS_44_ISF1]MDT8910963.1 DUF3180 domain-containing protein [Amycolatopsis sp. PS_44_ISF1]